MQTIDLLSTKVGQAKDLVHQKSPGLQRSGFNLDSVENLIEHKRSFSTIPAVAANEAQG